MQGGLLLNILGGPSLEVGSYLRWALRALKQGGLLPEVGPYLRWALTLT